MSAWGRLAGRALRAGRTTTNCNTPRSSWFRLLLGTHRAPRTPPGCPQCCRRSAAPGAGGWGRCAASVRSARPSGRRLWRRLAHQQHSKGHTARTAPSIHRRTLTPSMGCACSSFRSLASLASALVESWCSIAAPCRLRGCGTVEQRPTTSDSVWTVCGAVQAVRQPAGSWSGRRSTPNWWAGGGGGRLSAAAQTPRPCRGPSPTSGRGRAGAQAGRGGRRRSAGNRRRWQGQLGSAEGGGGARVAKCEER